MSEPVLSEADLEQFKGGDVLHPHWLGFSYTEGVAYLAERAGAHWLLDAVGSYQRDPRARAEPFQVWVLTRVRDPEGRGTGAVLEMHDGDHPDRPAIRQDIEYTDFPFGRVELFLTDGVLLLPGEY